MLVLWVLGHISSASFSLWQKHFPLSELLEIFKCFSCQCRPCSLELVEPVGMLLCQAICYGTPMLYIEEGGNYEEEGKDIFPKLARNMVFSETAAGTANCSPDFFKQFLHWHNGKAPEDETEKQIKVLHCSFLLNTHLSLAACQPRMSLMNPALASLRIQWRQGTVLTLKFQKYLKKCSVTCGVKPHHPPS